MPVTSYWLSLLPPPPHLSKTNRQEATEVIAGGKLTETQAKELFDKVDTDNSGVIEYEEFKQVSTPIWRQFSTNATRA